LKQSTTPKAAWPPGLEGIIKQMIRQEQTIKSDTPDARVAEIITEFCKVWNIDVNFANYQVHQMRQTQSKDEAFDLKSLLYTLEERKQADSNFIFVKEEDEADVKLKRVFFATAQQARNAARYGDVVVMDSTFGTNKYGWHLVFLVGVDANFNTCILAVALISNTDTPSFEWVLQQGKAIGIDPVTTLLDGADEEHKAAAKVFPDSQLMLCIYHFGIINVPKNLRGAFGEQWPSARSAFWSSYYATTVELFEHHFRNLKQIADQCLDFKVKSRVKTIANNVEGTVVASSGGTTTFNEASTDAQFTCPSLDLKCISDGIGHKVRDKALRYITNNMYKVRVKWAKCFTSQHFNASLQSTQRVESKFGQFKKGGWAKNSSLLEAISRIFTKEDEQETRRIICLYEADMKTARNVNQASFLSTLATFMNENYHPWLSSFIVGELKSVPLNYHANQRNLKDHTDGTFEIECFISPVSSSAGLDFITGPLDERKRGHEEYRRKARNVTIYASDVLFNDSSEITHVNPNSYAKKIGVEAGDLVTKIWPNSRTAISNSSILEVELKGPRSRRVVLFARIHQQTGVLFCVSGKCSCLREVSFGVPCKHILRSVHEMYHLSGEANAAGWTLSLSNLIRMRWKRVRERLLQLPSRHGTVHIPRTCQNQVAEVKRILKRISTSVECLNTVNRDSRKMENVIRSLNTTLNLLGIDDGLIASGSGTGKKAKRQQSNTEQRKESHYASSAKKRKSN